MPKKLNHSKVSFQYLLFLIPVYVNTPLFSQTFYNNNISIINPFFDNEDSTLVGVMGNVQISNGTAYTFGPLNTLFRNNGIWDGTAGTGSSQFFTGTGINTIAGTSAPKFFNLDFGPNITTMNITNQGGIEVYNQLNFQNGITTTNRSLNHSGSVFFQSGAQSLGDFSDTRHVNGYVSKSGTDNFTFHVGSGTDYRPLSISDLEQEGVYSVAWIEGDPSTNMDPSDPMDAQLHPVSSLGSNVVAVFTGGQWDWNTISGMNETIKIKVSIPDITAFASDASIVRLVGWNGTAWILIGNSGATGLTEGSELEGSFSLNGITAIGIGISSNTKIYLTCPGEINLSLDGNCEATNLASLLLGEKYPSDIFTYRLTTQSGREVNLANIKAYIGKKLKYEIISLSDGNSCWGYINIEDKFPLGLPILPDTAVYCIEGTLPTRTGTVEGNDCQGPWKTAYTDAVQDRKCTPDNDTIQVITRKWVVTNNNGHTAGFNQIIYVLAIPVDSVRGPKALVELECGNGILPSEIASKLGTASGYPFYVSPVNGDSIAIKQGTSCHFAASYVDQAIFDEVCKPGCKSSQKILRSWTVMDWCTGEVENYLQLIKKTDTTGPAVTVSSPDEIYSVNAWGCDVDITLPDALVLDNCDPDASIVKVEGILNNNPNISEPPTSGSEVLITVTKQANGRWLAKKVPQGIHTFVYTASDCCGNTASETITIEVMDRVAPVASAKEFITLSLTQSGNDAPAELGSVKLLATQVDNGSYDNCTPVRLEIRREGGENCYNEGTDGHNNNSTFDHSGHPQDDAKDTDNGEYVKFCCSDLNQVENGISYGIHKVILRVWDDANNSGVFGDTIEVEDGRLLVDNYNETWTNVRVEDKVIPKITCPAPIVTYCDRDTGVVPVYSFGKWTTMTEANTPKDFQPAAKGVCGSYTFEFKDAGSLGVCGTGTFTRTYRIVGFTSVSCNVTIEVEPSRNSPALEFPVSLHEWNSCVLTEADVELNTVRARIDNEDELLFGGCHVPPPPVGGGTVQHSQRNGQYCSTDVFDDSSGEDAYLPYNTSGTRRKAPASTSLNPVNTPSGSPRFNSSYKDPGCNVYGKKITIEEYNVGEGCKKWLVRWDYINWCCNEKSACRETIYKYEDTQAPVIVTCAGVDTDILDANCRAQFKLSPEARDEGGCDVGLTWRIRIFPGIANPSLAETNNPSLYTEYRTVNGLSTGGELQGVNPTFTHPTGLAAGVYGVVYLVRDGCGNVRECRSTISIWPKAATPYCVSISSAVMKNGLVELWARDFDRGSFTNCGNRALYYTFNREGKAEHPSVDPAHLTYEHYFTGLGNFLALKTAGGNSEGEAAARALYNEGKAQLWLPDVTVRQRPTLPDGTPQAEERILIGGSSGMQFGCNAASGLGPVNVEMRVWDSGNFKAGTTQGSDFCSTRLTLIDNQGGCGEGTLVVLGGTVQTKETEMMSGVEVTLKAELPQYPHTTQTNKDGKYEFKTLPTGVDYTIEASKTGDYLNGVNTLDLVQIQRHILGIERLANPYKMIAADADGDQVIGVNDIVTLRSLILGITDKIGEMPSWSFVDGSDKMENGPWPFREVISHASLTEVKMDNTFIGVKLGDVDGTAAVNVLSKQTEPRNTGIRLRAEDRLIQAGEEIVVPITAEQFTAVHGMQWTMKHEGLELIATDGRGIELKEDHTGKIRANTTTLSWASTNAITVAQGSEVMRLTFRANKAVKLSSSLQITSEVTNAEAYVGAAMERSSIVLEIRSNDISNDFYVGQNEPNPWRSGTVINYTLPKADAVKLTILDVTGRIISTYDANGVAGENEFKITREQISGASGILMYKIESGAYTAQRKMIVIE